MRESLFDFVKDANGVVMALHYNTTFGGEFQTMALVKLGPGRWDVVWWGRTWQSPEDVRPRHSKLPTPDEQTGVSTEIAQELMTSLSRVHVPFGHPHKYVVDDGAIAHIAVREGDHHVDLRWQDLSPDGWEELQKWFHESWDLMRRQLALPSSHSAIMMQKIEVTGMVSREASTTASPPIESRLPLVSLSRNGVVLKAVRKRHLGKEDIRQLLRGEGVEFVVADTGLPLEWVENSRRFVFWKDEVQQRLVPPDAERWNIEEFPGSYCYLASEWQVGSSQTVILLEKYH